MTMLAVLVLSLAGCQWGASPPAPKLIVVGIDGLGVGMLERLAKDNRAPNLTGLAREGVFTQLQNIQPVISPVVWASIATGKRPKKHGVDGWYSETDGSQRIVDARDIKVRRYWEILDERGVKCNTFAWLSLFPVIPGKGVTVASDYLWDRNLINDVDSTSILTGEELKYAISPVDLAKPLLAQRLPVQDGRDSPLGYQFPITPLEDHPMLRDQWTISAAVAVQARAPADVVSLYVKGIDELSHVFLPFTDAAFRAAVERDPRMYARSTASIPGVSLPWQGETITLEQSQLAARVVDDYAAWLDGALAPVLALRGPETNVIIVSDHGMLLEQVETAPNGDAGVPRPEHDPIATLILAGPAFKKAGHVASPSVIDVTPTILHLLGQPVPSDMDGRVLTEVLAAGTPVQTVPTYETSPRALPEVPHHENDAEMERLRALGYTQ